MNSDEPRNMVGRKIRAWLWFKVYVWRRLVHSLNQSDPILHQEPKDLRGTGSPSLKGSYTPGLHAKNKGRFSSSFPGILRSGTLNMKIERRTKITNKNNKLCHRAGQQTPSFDSGVRRDVLSAWSVNERHRRAAKRGVASIVSIRGQSVPGIWRTSIAILARRIEDMRRSAQYARGSRNHGVSGTSRQEVHDGRAATRITGWLLASVICRNGLGFQNPVAAAIKSQMRQAWQARYDIRDDAERDIAVENQLEAGEIPAGGAEGRDADLQPTVEEQLLRGYNGWVRAVDAELGVHEVQEFQESGVGERDAVEQMPPAVGKPSSADAAAITDVFGVGGGGDIVNDMVHQFLGEFPHEWRRSSRR
ncbi:hypothetical protein DFH09DRAFT_1282240 [Mycena vulgaris]|nr:hypothetical protein DFH09DRAFT_1282240 [Mycena vulgaris]